MPRNYTPRAMIVCRTCRKEYSVRAYLALTAHYCSRECKNSDPKRPRSSRVYVRVPLAERFWCKVNKSDGCWVWNGVRSVHGYGRLVIGKSAPYHVYAHRLSWELAFGPIPVGMHVLHHCDNPPCVRPDHLFLGTQSDNTKDMDAKGRRRNGPSLGSKNHFAKLSETQVRDIRNEYSAGTSVQELAVIYGADISTIRLIIHRKTWRHI